MRSLHAYVEQERHDLKQRLTFPTTISRAARRHLLMIQTVDNHAANVTVVADQSLKPYYRYTGSCALLAMGAFFTQWALWEKMTFCLGLAIVFAIVLGLAKNLYTRWRMRSYSTVEGRLLDPTPAMIEARLANKADAPFGIRALESGLEIAGVWISKSNLNAPVPSRPPSPTASSSSSFLDEPLTPSFAVIEDARPRVESTQSSIPSWYSPPKRSSDAGSAGSWTIATTGIKHVDAYRPRSTSSSAVNGHHFPRRSDASIWSDSSSIDETLKRILTVSSDDNSKLNSTSTVATSPSTSTDDGEQSGGTNCGGQIAKEDQLHSPEPHADLGLLYIHRLSHVAETGQLVPRNKRSPRTSGDWSRTASVRATRPRHPPISMHNRRKSRPLPSTPTDEVKDPIACMQDGKRGASLDFTFEEPSPPLKPESLPVTVVGESEQEQYTDVEDIVRFYEKHDGAISALATLSKPEPTYASLAFEHDRGAGVYRKVNENFQVLRPGAMSDGLLDGCAQGNNNAAARKKRQSRRLSKERPTSGSCNGQSFIEVLYGDERRVRS